jgi:hypothetical protein
VLDLTPARMCPVWKAGTQTYVKGAGASRWGWGFVKGEQEGPLSKRCTN